MPKIPNQGENYKETVYGKDNDLIRDFEGETAGMYFIVVQNQTQDFDFHFKVDNDRFLVPKGGTEVYIKKMRWSQLF